MPLTAKGVPEAVLVVGYRAEQVKQRVGRNFVGLSIRYVEAPRSVDRPRLLADASVARRALGWQPRTSIREGLTRALERPFASGREPAA